jgi:hypothetical protein
VVDVSIQAVAPESFTGALPSANKGCPAPRAMATNRVRFQIIGSSGKDIEWIDGVDDSKNNLYICFHAFYKIYQ